MRPLHLPLRHPLFLTTALRHRVRKVSLVAAVYWLHYAQKAACSAGYRLVDHSRRNQKHRLSHNRNNHQDHLQHHLPALPHHQNHHQRRLLVRRRHLLPRLHQLLRLRLRLVMHRDRNLRLVAVEVAADVVICYLRSVAVVVPLAVVCAR